MTFRSGLLTVCVGGMTNTYNGIAKEQSCRGCLLNRHVNCEDIGGHVLAIWHRGEKDYEGWREGVKSPISHSLWWRWTCIHLETRNFQADL